MTAIVADSDVEGHVTILTRILQNETWIEFWSVLGRSVLTFEEMGLRRDASDALIWHTCQRHDAVLITRNRNAEGPDSLEATLRIQSTPDCLPVFTLANSERVLRDQAYAERVAERLLDYLTRIDEIRGTGRLYLP